jgi:hypothetical protein
MGDDHLRVLVERKKVDVGRREEGTKASTLVLVVAMRAAIANRKVVFMVVDWCKIEIEIEIVSSF